MKRAGAVCPNCGSTNTPTKEKMMGQYTQDLICTDCNHMAWWSDFQPENQNKDKNKNEKL